MKRLLILAVVGLAGVAQSASANFIFSNVRTPIAGSTTLQQITFSALNDGTGYSAGSSKLQSLEMTITASNAMVFNSSDLNGDGRADVNLTAPSASLGSAAITGTKVPSEIFDFYFNFNFAGIDPTPSNISSATYNAVTAYTGLKSFYGVGTTLNPAPPLTANVGTGAKFLSVVAPIGTTVSIVGGIAGETGGVGSTLLGDEMSPSLQPGLTPFSYTASVPEPTSLALLGLTGAALLRRRRA